MKFKISFLTGCLLCFFGGLASPASANDRLSFDAAVSPYSKQRISAFVSKMLGVEARPFSLALTDLNGDGMDEFILKNDGCGVPPALCTFRILAESTDSFVELGRIRARNVALADGSVAGVRTIMAFASPINDYDYELYVWEPTRSRYILSEGDNNKKQ